MTTVAAVIAAFEPGPELMSVVEYADSQVDSVIVVDDGSAAPVQADDFAGARCAASRSAGRRACVANKGCACQASRNASVPSPSSRCAHASSLEPLSEADARFYRAAFAASDHGDFDAAEAALANTRDKSLAGRLEFSKIMHPRAYAASYDELTGWLASYGDQAGAELEPLKLATIWRWPEARECT